MKHKFYIDFHKGITFFYILFLIEYFHQWSNNTIMIYLALHGSYGIMWVIKSMIYPDKSWERKVTIFYGLYTWIGLSLYWISPILIVSGYFNNGQPVIASPLLLFWSVFIYSIGVFLHFTSDMQKHTILNIKKNTLITDGMFKKCRNINYFGELLIYSSFSMLSMHWLPFAILGLFLVIVWIPNMYKKEKSLSRYDDFNDYKINSKLFIPFIY